MKQALLQLRSLIIVTFILTVASACSQGDGLLAGYSEATVAQSAEFSTPSAVPDLQSDQGGSTETPLLQSTTSNGASNRHFDCAALADENATIAVTTETLINGDLVLEVSDEIAVFSSDGDICAGMAVWNGQNIAITAWGDDSRTEEIDGLVNGDPLQFRIWDASEQVAYQVTNVDYQKGDGIFVEDGIYIVAALTVGEQ